MKGEHLRASVWNYSVRLNLNQELCSLMFNSNAEAAAVVPC